jgi:hypothetical protein
MSVYKDESVGEKCEKRLSVTLVIVSRRNLKCKSEQLEAYYIAMRRHLLCTSQLASLYFLTLQAEGSAQVTNDHIL